MHGPFSAQLQASSSGDHAIVATAVRFALIRLIQPEAPFGASE